MYKRGIQISFLILVSLLVSSCMSREEIAAREAARQAAIAAIPQTSSQDLCRRVGVSKDTWPYKYYSYWHFADRNDEFIKALQARGVDAVLCSDAGARCISFGNGFGSPAFRKCAFDEARADEELKRQAAIAAAARANARAKQYESFFGNGNQNNNSGYLTYEDHVEPYLINRPNNFCHSGGAYCTD